MSLVAVPLEAARVPAERWNALARRGFHLHRWHALAEECGWRPRHVGVAGAHGLLAIVPAYLIARDTYGNLHDRWTGPLAGLAERAGVRLAPVLAATAPFGCCASEPLGDFGALDERALDLVFDRLEARAREDGAVAVAWPDVAETDVRLVAHARRRGYAALYAGASARLDVAWRTPEEYLASRSKSVRRTIRLELRTIGDLRVERRADFRDAAPLMAALHRESQEGRGGRGTPLPPDFFDRLAERPAPGIWAQLTWAGTRLVGASLNLAAGGVVDGTLASVAADWKGTPVYYNDLVYHPLRIACAEGFHAIDLGPTALVPKVLRGARLYRRVTLVRATSPAARPAVAAMGRVVAAWTERKERQRLAVLGGRAEAAA